MIRCLSSLFHSVVGFQLTRQTCLRTLTIGFILGLALIESPATATDLKEERSILDAFLGEELTYEIGFWLFPHCGESTVRLIEAERPGLYRASVEGRTAGLADWLVGRFRYSYVSYCELAPGDNRLRPLRFELSKRRKDREARRIVAFDYEDQEISFVEILDDGTRKEEAVPMEEGIAYEDYLTLFYNFRHGSYGRLERNHTYHLPIHADRDMDSLDLFIATQEEEEERRGKESNRTGKDFFVRFQVNREDVSSTSGDIEGWLSHETVPVKGTIKDVILFGDLWGNLMHRRIGTVSQRD
jgi:hypothetical protein